MSSEEAKDGFSFTCDCCGDEWTPPRLGCGSERRTFEESWLAAKDDGWRAKKVRSSSGKEDWEHRCSSCV